MPTPYDAMKEWINKASYEQLLRRWRFAEVGDPIFQGAIGAYYSEVMRRRRAEVGSKAHTQISKRVGW